MCYLNVRYSDPHCLLFFVFLALVFTRIWFAGYDIASVHTQSDVLDGTVSIMMMILYIGLGVYSHRLAYRLFVHPKFLELMRLHSKTIIKLNAAVVLQIILVTFVVVQVGPKSFTVLTMNIICFI